MAQVDLVEVEQKGAAAAGSSSSSSSRTAALTMPRESLQLHHPHSHVVMKHKVLAAETNLINQIPDSALATLFEYLDPLTSLFLLQALGRVTFSDSHTSRCVVPLLSPRVGGSRGAPGRAGSRTGSPVLPGATARSGAFLPPTPRTTASATPSTAASSTSHRAAASSGQRVEDGQGQGPVTVAKGKGSRGNVYTSSNASTAGGVSSRTTSSEVGPVVLPLSNFETGIVPIPSKLPLLKSLHISDVSLRDKDQDVEELIWLLTDCTESVEVVRIGGCSEATFLSDTAVTRALQIGDKNFVLGQRRDGSSPGGRHAKKPENFAAPGVALAAREDVEAEKILLLARLRKWFAKNFERLRDTFSAQELGRSESVQQLLKGAASTNSLHMMVSDLDQSCSEAGYISRSGSEEDLHVGATSASDGELLDSVLDFEEAAGDDMQMQLVYYEEDVNKAAFDAADVEKAAAQGAGAGALASNQNKHKPLVNKRSISRGADASQDNPVALPLPSPSPTYASLRRSIKVPSSTNLQSARPRSATASKASASSERLDEVVRSGPGAGKLSGRRSASAVALAGNDGEPEALSSVQDGGRRHAVGRNESETQVVLQKATRGGGYHGYGYESPQEGCGHDSECLPLKMRALASTPQTKSASSEELRNVANHQNKKAGPPAARAVRIKRPRTHAAADHTIAKQELITGLASSPTSVGATKSLPSSAATSSCRLVLPVPATQQEVEEEQALDSLSHGDGDGPPGKRDNREDHEHDEQASSDEDEDNFFEDVGSEDSDGDLDQLDPDFVRATVSRYSASGQQATAMNESNSKHAFFPSSTSTSSTYYRYNAHTGNLPTTEEERAEIEKYMNPCIPPCLLRALNCCTKLRSLTLTRVDYSSLENVGRLQLPSLVWLVMQFSLDRNYRWNFSELFWTPKLQVLHVENRSKTSADLISDFPQLTGVLDLLQLLEARGNLAAFRVLKSRRMNLDREEIGPVLTLLGKGVAAAAFGEGKHEQVEEASTSSTTGRVGVNVNVKAEDAGPARPDKNYSEESRATSRRPRVFHSATGLQALSFTCHPQLPLSVQSMLYHRMALGLPAFGVHRNGIVAAQQWPATWPSLNCFWPEMAKITAFNVFASDITFSEFDTEPETEWNQLEEEEKAFFEELAEYFREKRTRRAYGYQANE